MTARPLPTLIERGQRRVFASVADWPGWCRSAKDEDTALAALASYAERYAVVVRAAGRRMPARPTFEVVERVKGNATTDFGAPGAIARADREALSKAQAQRLVDLLEASWSVLDDVVAAAPSSLRKGPRGGGRDRDAIAQHVVAAEAAYARKLGLTKVSEPTYTDRDSVRALRDRVVEAVLARPEDTKWPVRYAVRRFAWHVLDHAWEIEDKSE